MRRNKEKTSSQGKRAVKLRVGNAVGFTLMGGSGTILCLEEYYATLALLILAWIYSIYRFVTED